MKIPFNAETERFQKHIELEDNRNIIFSGVFGIGKTYFLKDFFETNENYKAFKVYPVNYSIASNEDIIDYVKYDLAFQLLAEDIKFEKTDFSKLLTSQFYLQENFLDTAMLLAKGFGKVGKTVSDIYSNLKKIKENIEEHNEGMQIDEEKSLVSYLKSIKNDSSTIYEENRITELISLLFEKVKIKEGSKKLVLLIDDLDRIDPEHIFRLLNVFSVHLEFGTTELDKFGFEKVILVCDINNIRNIFHSKYGQNVDFSGYIDKFYSREVFEFDNRRAIKSSIAKVLKSIKTDSRFDVAIDLKNSNKISFLFLDFILSSLVRYNLINLRSILRLYERDFDLRNFLIKLNEDYSSARTWQFLMFLEINVLVGMLGSIDNVREAIVKLAEKEDQIYRSKLSNQFIGFLVSFIDGEKSKGEGKELVFEVPKLDLKIEHTTKPFGDLRDFYYSKVSNIESLSGNRDLQKDFLFGNS